MGALNVLAPDAAIEFTRCDRWQPRSPISRRRLRAFPVDRSRACRGVASLIRRPEDPSRDFTSLRIGCLGYEAIGHTFAQMVLDGCVKCRVLTDRACGVPRRRSRPSYQARNCGSRAINFDAAHALPSRNGADNGPPSGGKATLDARLRNGAYRLVAAIRRTTPGGDDERPRRRRVVLKVSRSDPILARESVPSPGQGGRERGTRLRCRWCRLACGQSVRAPPRSAPDYVRPSARLILARGRCQKAPLYGHCLGGNPRSSPRVDNSAPAAMISGGSAEVRTRALQPITVADTTWCVRWGHIASALRSITFTSGRSAGVWSRHETFEYWSPQMGHDRFCIDDSIWLRRGVDGLHP